MKILFLAPEPPAPPISGARIRNLNLIRGLALRHEVSLLTFGDSATPEVADLCREVALVPAPLRTKARRVRDLVRMEPDLARRLLSPAMADRTREMVGRQRPDLIHVGGLEMAFAAYPLRDRAAILFDEHNAEYVLQRRAFENECRIGGKLIAGGYSLLQWLKLRRFEAWACRVADGTMAVSPVDAAAIRAAAGDVRIAVVPNTIDVADYPPRDSKRVGPPTVVFTGKMDYRPNVDAVVWFVSAVWPRIHSARPDARFLIVGRNPTPAVASLVGTAGVTVTGEVPDDRPYVENASVFVVPMRVGGGVRIKVLQAMAAGVPIVSTSLGYEGVAAVPGVHLDVSDEPAEFAAAVLGLINDPSGAATRLQTARALVESAYDWRALAPTLDEFYRETVERATRRLGGSPPASDR
jgi:glycosyltransferase involved in cell wall biosynthesis